MFSTFTAGCHRGAHTGPGRVHRRHPDRVIPQPRAHNLVGKHARMAILAATLSTPVLDALRRRPMPKRPVVAAAAGEGGRSLSITSTRAAGRFESTRPSRRASQAGIERTLTGPRLSWWANSTAVTVAGSRPPSRLLPCSSRSACTWGSGPRPDQRTGRPRSGGPHRFGDSLSPCRRWWRRALLVVSAIPGIWPSAGRRPQRHRILQAPSTFLARNVQLVY